MVLQKQPLDSSSQERRDRLPRRIYDGLPLDVEARVEKHFSACDSAYLFQENVKIRVIFCRYRLYPGAPIDVSDGRKRLAMRVPHIYRRDHVG